MLRAVLNKSWRHHPTKLQLYGIYHPSRKPSNFDEPDMLETTGEAHKRYAAVDPFTKVGWPARAYMPHLSAPTGCSLEDLPGAIEDRDGWREGVRESRASGATWWYRYIYIYHIVVESDQKAPFSIATTSRCRGGHYSLPWIALLYPW